MLNVLGGIPKIWGVPGFAHALYSPKFLRGFCSYVRYDIVERVVPEDKTVTAAYVGSSANLT